MTMRAFEGTSTSEKHTELKRAVTISGSFQINENHLFKSGGKKEDEVVMETAMVVTVKGVMMVDTM